MHRSIPSNKQIIINWWNELVEKIGKMLPELRWKWVPHHWQEKVSEKHVCKDAGQRLALCRFEQCPSTWSSKGIGSWHMRQSSWILRCCSEYLLRTRSTVDRSNEVDKSLSARESIKWQARERINSWSSAKSSSAFLSRNVRSCRSTWRICR